MRLSLFAFLILLIGACQCSAHGSMVYGYDSTNGIHFLTSQDESTPERAETAALRKCVGQGLNNCTSLGTFQNSCWAVAVTSNELSSVGTGEEIDEAMSDAVSVCQAEHKASCAATTVTCDGTQSAAPGKTIAPINLAWIGPFLLSLQVLLGASVLAILVFTALVLWVFASVVSTAPVHALRRKCVVTLWVGLPSMFCVALWFVDYHILDRIPLILVAAAFLWTDVFAALLIGGRLQKRFVSGRQPPEPTSLPVAVLIFTIIALAPVSGFFFYGGLPSPPGCGSEYQSPISLCGAIQYAIQYEGYSLVGGLWLIAIFCGFVLPQGSNLIRANDRLRASVHRASAKLCADFGSYRKRRRLRRQQREAARKEEAEKREAEAAQGSYPVPVISEVETVDAMRLKLRRSQRSGFLGKIIFVLDARMEITAEEYELVRRYHLGDDVIYESSSRKQRQQAAQAHLEMTREQSRLTDSAGTQLLGAGKTFYRLARASISATAAALSLRITISSLMSGVHIECKSMGELLGAETAIIEASQNLRSYLETAATFDGQEEIIEF